MDIEARVDTCVVEACVGGLIRCTVEERLKKEELHVFWGIESLCKSIVYTL